MNRADHTLHTALSRRDLLRSSAAAAGSLLYAPRLGAAPISAPAADIVSKTWPTSP